MKNLLKSAFYLTTFALAGILFQLSCSNSDDQLLSPSSTPIGKIAFAKQQGSTAWEIWTCNYDGTNLTQVPFTLPTYVQFSTININGSVKLSPDGQKVFFLAYDYSALNFSIYSCNIDGSNTQEVTPVFADQLELGGAY